MLTAALYAPSRGVGTVYEDAHWQQALRSGLTWRLPGAIVNKPLATWTLQGSLPAQHLANVGLHLLNGVGVYAIAAMLVGSTAAAAAAVIFLLDPFNSEAVTYLSARSDLLLTLCVLLAVAATLRRPPSPLMVALPVVLLPVAVWCDQLGLLLAPLVAVTLWCWRPASPRRSFRLMTLLVVLAVWLTMAGPQIATEWHIGYTVEGANRAWPNFWVLQATALWHLLWLIVDPRGLSIDHAIVTLGLRWTVFALAATTLTLVAVVLAWRRSTLTAWVLACSLISVAPHFVFRTNEWFSEHQLYLAMPWISIGLGASLAWGHAHGDRLAALVAAAWRWPFSRHLSLRST